MPFWVATASTSPAVKPALIVALAPVIWVSSASLSVIVLSMVAAAAFSVYARVAPAAATGVSFTAVTLMFEVTPVLVCAPTPSLFASVAAQVTLRLALLAVGSSDVLL